LLVRSSDAGVVIGKGGNGFKELRALGVALEMDREDVTPGERLLTVTGGALAVSAAVNTVIAKLSARSGTTSAAAVDTVVAKLSAYALIGSLMCNQLVMRKRVSEN